MLSPLYMSEDTSSPVKKKQLADTRGDKGDRATSCGA